MHILFVNVIDSENKIHKRYFPLSFGYLVSYAEEHGYKFESYYIELISKDVINAFKPDVVALTSITENYERAKRYANFIKRVNPKIKVVIGGIHISSVPTSLSSDMDIGVVGEGEQTFLELLQSNFEPSDKIDGIVYWKNNQLFITHERGLIEPLDNIPHPKRNIYGSDRREPYLFTSRGCSYRCIFCSSSRFWKKVRFHSAEYIVEEIKQLLNDGCHFINIYDDCFPLDMNRVRKVRDLVKGLDVKFFVAVRANLVTEEMAAVFRDMNVTGVGMGLESNSRRILEYLQKGNTPEDNQKAVDILRAHSIQVSCSFIRDVPGETEEDLRLTYDFIKRNRLSFDMYRLMKFPNTPIYDGSENWSNCRVFNYQQHQYGLVPQLVRRCRYYLKMPPKQMIIKAKNKVLRALKT